ncbi:MAG: Uma2 family endonuclease [Cyanobacteria bacterium]|nr:Uma2 family endonuclease [Cyanobacteriota bacterium]MDW8200175.1 Uma2 family endonuclease [Cyanobacteriota bacterium SKYGB_h_bin112]
MTDPALELDRPRAFPDHTQLPESDGTFVKNFQEHPQSILLTDSLSAVLQRLHPDGQYCIGQDSGIYWRETDPPEKGAVAPDWFYVPGVPAQLDGQYRRSYVLWRELITPLIVLEFASGDGSEERDVTPFKGKFWVYERVLRVPYYGIYEIQSGRLEVYHLNDITYERMTPNDRGHYPIPPMQVELGLWRGTYQNQEMLWLRWWDLDGNLLLIGSEQAVLERQRAEQERQRAEAAERELAELRSRLQQLDG